jgi:hypothetical protein
MVNLAELEFKECLESRGWKVYKLDGKGSSSKELDWRVMNIKPYLETFVNSVGLPDFFIYKYNFMEDGIFVEVKFKNKLSDVQKETMRKIQAVTGLNTYIAKKEERGNIEITD